jgi:outer membrane protein OmpA-like peptidoglycan-associated protein
MSIRSITPMISTSLLVWLLVPYVGWAQFGAIGRRASSAVSNQIGNEIDRLLRDGVRCVFNDVRCVERARAEGKTPVMTDSSGNVMTDDEGRPLTDPAAAAAKAGAPQKPGSGAWVNYDFVPGDRVLFYSDYSGDNVGDFPRRFELLAGNWEVAEWQGQRYLRGTANGTIALRLPTTLPERFTVEFPASVQHGNAYLRLSTAPINHGKRDFQGSAPSLEFTQAGLRPVRNAGPLTVVRRREGADRNALVTVRVMADGDYVKMYLDDHRVANAPNAVFPRTDTLFFTINSASEPNPVMIGPVRIAAGGRDLYDRLEAEGRVATHGILFAVNSDLIRPESTPTLKEIGDMLTAHRELRLAIEGHTDSDGDDTYNLDLSRRRAAAVKTVLVESFGVDSGRLSTEGFGETRPAADNGTPEGRQQNRRVELVKQAN